MGGSAEQGSGLGYRPALDGLRALAVGAVFAYHLDGRGLRGGFLGVDTFFVLSGFLITTLLLLEIERTRHVALVAFCGRRLRRLLPALLGVIAAVAVAAWFASGAAERASLRGDSIAGLLYVANWRFVASGQSYFDLFSAPSPLRHLWSLAIEEQFYLVWPLVVLSAAAFAGRRVVRTRVVVGVVATIGAGASIWAMARMFDGTDPSRAYYGTDARVHTILIGCILAAVVLHRRPRTRVAHAAVQATGVVALVGVLVAFATVSDRGAWLYRGGSVVFALAVAAVVLAASQDDGVLVRVLGVGPARVIGRMSYGIYLWHWPVIVWMTPARVHLDGAALAAARLAVTFGAATLSYHFLEMPIRRGALRGRWGLVAVPATIGAVCAAVILATAGGSPAPAYLGGASGMSFALPCPAASAPERAAAVAAAGARSVNRAAHAPARLLVVGDSVACSLGVGLDVTRPSATRIADASVIGCGAVAGRAVSPVMRTPRYQQRCDRYVDEAMRRGRRALGGSPDAVLIVSTWERFDLVTARGVLRAGTKAWEDELRRRYDGMIGRFVAEGARVFVAIPAPSTEGSFIGVAVTHDPTLDTAMLRLDDFLERYVARRGGSVTALDLSTFVCPGGPPCAPVVHGARLRPLDGTHFGPEGAVRVARWMWSRVERSVDATPSQRAGR